MDPNQKYQGLEDSIQLDTLDSAKGPPVIDTRTSDISLPHSQTQSSTFFFSPPIARQSRAVEKEDLLLRLGLNLAQRICHFW